MNITDQQFSALIDIGSNSMRLVIYEKEKTGRFREVENVKEVARLSNHLDDDRNLTDEGIAILLATLANFSDILAIYPYQHFLCTATATIRQANNREDLIQLVKAKLDWDMIILSEEEEAYFGYLAVVNSTAIEEGITVDIGGGSTEVTYFKDRKLVHSHSFSFGTLSLKTLYQGDCSEAENAAKVRAFVMQEFNSIPWLVERHLPLIGIGGSARNLAQIDQNEKSYPMAGLHQYEMELSDIERILTQLKASPLKKREKIEGLSKDRADIIIPAVETFATLYDTVKANQFILSQKGLRDGLNYQLLLINQQPPYFPNVLEESLHELVIRYDMDMKQISHVLFLTRKIFNQLVGKQVKGLSHSDWFHLAQASYVFNLGAYIDAEASAQYTFFLLANKTIDGLLNKDKLKVALIASYKNRVTYKQFVKPFKSWLTKQERNKLQLLGSLLKFTYSLDATKRQIIKNVDLTIKQKKIHCVLYYEKNPSAERYQVEKQKKHLEKELNKTIVLHFNEI